MLKRSLQTYVMMTYFQNLPRVLFLLLFNLNGKRDKIGDENSLDLEKYHHYHCHIVVFEFELNIFESI